MIKGIKTEKMTPEVDNNMEVLVFRYLRGKATDEEIAKVELWMNESPDNGKLMEQLCIIDFANETLQCMRHAKPKLSLKKVRKKCNISCNYLYIIIMGVG